MISLIPVSCALACARAIPASVLWSVMASAAIPSSFACSMSSSTRLAPRRKLKFEQHCSST